MPLTLLLNGSRGRMGQAVSAVAAELGFRVGAAVDVGDQPAAGIEDCDVIVDFSTPSATAELLRLAVSNRKPIVIGTTGHAAAEKRRLLAVAGKVPCVWSGNFSVGVNLLFYLTQRAAHILDAAYDAEVVEMHHRFKKDAPSGTATRLLEIILQERKLTAEALRHGRPFPPGRRRGRRPHGDFRRLGRTPRTHAQDVGPRDSRPRCAARSTMGCFAAGGRLRHAGRARVAGLSSMITSIQGTLAAVSPLLAVVELNGLGYDVSIPTTTAERLPPPGCVVRLHTHVVYREDSQTLYGFATSEERDFFRLLIEKVTGVGPKMALSIMSRFSLPVLRGAIASGDVATLARCPGIGRKTAERLVIELKGLFAPASGIASATSSTAAASAGEGANPQRDAVMALIALGYRAPDADKVVRQAWISLGSGATTEQLIKKALG